MKYRRTLDEINAISTLLGDENFTPKASTLAYSGSPDTRVSASVSSQSTASTVLTAYQNHFYRHGNRIIRVGLKKDGVSPYRFAFYQRHLRAFLNAMTLVASDRKFRISNGVLNHLGDGLNRQHAYVINSWLVNRGLVHEIDRNLYWIASDSIAEDAQAQWEATPTQPPYDFPHPTGHRDRHLR